MKRTVDLARTEQKIELGRGQYQSRAWVTKIADFGHLIYPKMPTYTTANAEKNA